MINASIRRLSGRSRSFAGARGRLRTWTRRLHFYVGLYLLLFVWLFAVSGLFLNHPEWEITHGFWDRRQESSFQRVIAPPIDTGDLATARDLMRQLGIVGEINEITRSPADDQFGFQVVRPGRIFNVETDLAARTATVKRIDLNAWGMLDALHKFTGVSMDRPGRERDWVLTMIWSVAMDAVALGLLVLVLSGLYLWYRLAPRRRTGLIALGLGTLLCGFFLFGLARMF